MTEKQKKIISIMLKIPYDVFALPFTLLSGFVRFVRKRTKRGFLSPEDKKMLMKSKTIRWDLIEKGADLSRDYSISRTHQTPTRLPEARGKMPPLTPKPVSVRNNTPARPLEMAGRGSAVLAEAGRPVHRNNRTSVSRNVEAQGASPDRATLNLRRGEVVKVTIPERHETVQATIANAGSSEIMLLLGTDDALDISLTKGQRVLLGFKSTDGVLQLVDAEIAGTSGVHSDWFSVKYDSMKFW